MTLLSSSSIILMLHRSTILQYVQFSCSMKRSVKTQPYRFRFTHRPTILVSDKNISFRLLLTCVALEIVYATICFECIAKEIDEPI